MTPKPSWRRFGAGLTAAITAVATIVATGASASADPSLSPLASDDKATAAAVTLITGDRALVGYAADGTPTATLESTEDFYTRSFGDDLYVIPVAAEPLLANGSLDPELFNVTGLVRSGYDDASRADIPLITTGAVPRARGVDAGVSLESIGATAMSVDKAQAGDMFDSLGMNRSVTGKIWLDAKVEGFELDPATGVEQTGAPAAWESGHDGEGTKVAILDTGYDAEHPDLTGQVVAHEDFTGEGSALDQNGHGTHVASTVAGTGAASDGSRAGMAPGADLLIGRVLSWGGGQTSWIVAGMEWAVDQGADVVNMSLGSTAPTDCTDPMAEATRTLAEQSDTLFVLAAGNSALRETISSPACVESVLTVGAIDADSATADFSSRGPTLGTHSVKPDITAPGVAIVGAANGSDGDNHYTAMSGTSMAAPHVAGAAALVKQAHPDWSAQQIKQALTSAVKQDPSDTVYAQGAGELWVPGAIESTVSSNGSLKLAEFTWPHSGGETSGRKITYTNTGDKNVKLTLKLTDVVGANGDKMPKSAIKLGAKKITVPAGGSVTVPVTARDVTKGVDSESFGEISARVIATGKHVRVTTAIGYWLEAQTVDLTVKAIGRDGEPATVGFLEVFQIDTDRYEGIYFNGEDVKLRVRTGTVSISGFIGAPLPDRSYTYVGAPETEITEDTTLVFDARDAKRIKVKTDQPTQARGATLHYARSDDRWLTAASVYSHGDDVAMYALPTGKSIKEGEFTFSSYWRMYAADVATKDSPYVYNLGFSEDGKVGAKQTHTVDRGDLAAVSEEFYAHREDSTFFESLKVVPEGEAQLFVGTGMLPVSTPMDRTAYYSPDLAWQTLGIGSDSRFGADLWFDPVKVYEAGQEYQTTWNKLPSQTGLWYNTDGSPSRIAERQGNLMGFSFAQWKDAEAGRYGIGGFGDLGGLSLWENGVFLGDSGWASGQAVVSSEPSDYLVKVTHLRTRLGTPQLPGLHLGLATISEFGFSSHNPGGEKVAALPILMPSYDIDVDQRNLVPADVVAIPVDFITQDGVATPEVTEFTAQVCFEEVDILGSDKPVEDYNWTDVEVEYRDGRWVALIDNSAAPGTYPSLHITATDANGNSVDQYALSLYGVA